MAKQKMQRDLTYANCTVTRWGSKRYQIRIDKLGRKCKHFKVGQVIGGKKRGLVPSNLQAPQQGSRIVLHVDTEERYIEYHTLVE